MRQQNVGVVLRCLQTDKLAGFVEKRAQDSHHMIVGRELAQLYVIGREREEHLRRVFPVAEPPRPGFVQTVLELRAACPGLVHLNPAVRYADRREIDVFQPVFRRNIPAEKSDAAVAPAHDIPSLAAFSDCCHCVAIKAKERSRVHLPLFAAFAGFAGRCGLARG